MVETELGGGPARFGQHFGCHVHADDATGGPNLAGGDEGVEPGAGADVDDSLTDSQRSQ